MVELPSIGGMRPRSGRSAQQRVTPLSNATVQSQFNAQREFYRQQYAERRQALVERRRAAAMRQAAERRESAKDRRGSGLLQGADRQSGKKEESTKAEVSTSAEKSGGVVDELGQPAGLMAVPKVSEEKRQALVASKKQEQQSLKEYGEFVDMSGRPISWSDSQKAAAQKAASSGNVLEAAAAQQYLWMDDPDAFLSAANIEKRTSDALKILNIDTSKKSNTGNPVVDFAAEFVKGAADLVPSTLRVISAGGYAATQLAKQPKMIYPILSEATGKWITTSVDNTIENPAYFAGGVAASLGIGGSIRAVTRLKIKNTGSSKSPKLFVVREIERPRPAKERNTISSSPQSVKTMTKTTTRSERTRTRSSPIQKVQLRERNSQLLRNTAKEWERQQKENAKIRELVSQVSYKLEEIPKTRQQQMDAAIRNQRVLNQYLAGKNAIRTRGATNQKIRVKTKNGVYSIETIRSRTKPVQEQITRVRPGLGTTRIERIKARESASQRTKQLAADKAKTRNNTKTLEKETEVNKTQSKVRTKERIKVNENIVQEVQTRMGRARLIAKTLIKEQQPRELTTIQLIERPRTKTITIEKVGEKEKTKTNTIERVREEERTKTNTIERVREKEKTKTNTKTKTKTRTKATARPRKKKEKIRSRSEEEEKKKKMIIRVKKRPYTRKETVNQLPWLEVDKVPPAKPIRLYR